MKKPTAISAGLRLFYGMQGAVDQAERWEVFRDFLRELADAGDAGAVRELRALLTQAQQIVDEVLPGTVN